MLFNPPTLIAHADWSKDAKKRWIAKAALKKGRYIAKAPGRWGTPVHCCSASGNRLGPGERS